MKFKTRLTADSTEFTDAFSTHRILKVAQIFNLPYRHKCPVIARLKGSFGL